MPYTTHRRIGALEHLSLVRSHLSFSMFCITKKAFSAIFYCVSWLKSLKFNVYDRIHCLYFIR